MFDSVVRSMAAVIPNYLATASRNPTPLCDTICNLSCGAKLILAYAAIQSRRFRYEPPRHTTRSPLNGIGCAVAGFRSLGRRIPGEGVMSE